MTYLLLVTLLALFSKINSFGFVNCGGEGKPVLTTNTCSSTTFCRHRCYYNYNQRVVKFDSSSDELETNDGLPFTSYTSQYAVDATGFNDVRNQYLEQQRRLYLQRRWSWSSFNFKGVRILEDEEKNTNENDDNEDENTQFFGYGWGYYRPPVYQGVSDLTHKVDDRGKYVSIDVEIKNPRQAAAYDYTCVRGAYLKSDKTIQHIIDEYTSIINKVGYCHKKEDLSGFMKKDIEIIADFNKNCKNAPGQSFIEKYKAFVNQKYSKENYARNIYFAEHYYWSADYFNNLGKILQMFSNYPVCRCSVFRYFTLAFGAPNGWTSAERTAAVNDINNRCTEALNKQFGSRATLIREY